MTKNHNLLSYVAFVDLVRPMTRPTTAFFLTFFERYRAPPLLVSAIECINKDLVVGGGTES
jgi:hypothetical protein